MLTDRETAILEHLRDAWNLFRRVDSFGENLTSTTNLEDFTFMIHRLQDMVAARPIYRYLKESK